MANVVLLWEQGITGQMVSFEHVRTVPLAYDGECSLLGVGPDLGFYAEEIYGDEGWMAQRQFDFEGESLDGVDEACGENQGAERLKLPHNLVRPHSGSNVLLNFGGVRHYGSVDDDHIEEMVRPLTMADKALLVEEGWVPSVAPPDILGLAQSYVASEVQLQPGGVLGQPLFLLSRRLRIAFRLPEGAVGDLGEVIDYDSCEVAMLQRYNPRDGERPFEETVLGSAELSVELNWPTDVVLREDYLFVADAARGREGCVSRVHIWRVAFDG